MLEGESTSGDGSAVGPAGAAQSWDGVSHRAEGRGCPELAYYNVGKTDCATGSHKAHTVYSRVLLSLADRENARF